MIKDVDGLIKHITKEIQTKTDVAVIGLSGGADSTLIAILCMLALGKDNVVGVHMPYNDIDTKDIKFNGRSQGFASTIGIKSMFIPITSIADSIISSISAYDNIEISDLDKGNARARARMTVLYGLSGALSHDVYKGKRIRVIGTGNMSEDYIGYDTKGGDALADFHPIGRLFKSEVYQLLNHFIKTGIIGEVHVDRVPSAGLWSGQTDEKELGHTYNEMEPCIRKMIDDNRNPVESFNPDWTDLEKFVIDRHLANDHKHAAIPSLNVRDYVD